MKKGIFVGLGVVALAIICVLGMTLFRGTKTAEQAGTLADTSVGDPGQTMPKEESVDYVEPLPLDAEEDAVVENDVAAESEMTQDEEMFSCWATLSGEDSSSYERVTAHDRLLGLFMEEVSKGNEPEIIQTGVDADYSGFKKISIDLGGRVLELYSIVLPTDATLFNSRSSLIVILKKEGEIVYSEFLFKKDRYLLDNVAVLGESQVALFGPGLDSSFDSQEKTWFVKGMLFGAASSEPIEVVASEGLGTIVVAESEGTIYLKSGKEGVSLVPVNDVYGLQFICTDGSEVLNVGFNGTAMQATIIANQ